MRTYCILCHSNADFIDRKTGLCPDCPSFNPEQSDLVSRQSAEGSVMHARNRFREMKQEKRS